MADEAPLELVLSVTKGSGLSAELLNRSHKEQRYCYDRFWQSCDLTLTNSSGESLKNDDRRTRMKPTDPIDLGAFGILGPGERNELISGDFTRSEDGNYELHWGYCTFNKIPPGTYKAAVVMECQRDSGVDENRKWHKAENVWIGTLSSKEAKIILPG
jgi:hypothetical protein